jgi:regulator of protease activity HflC (stomatin/prohibitin superfamily)
MPLIVSKVVLTDFQWDPKFAASVQENMKAKNEAKRAEYVLEQTKLEAQQVTAKALGEAEANRARAGGEKDAMIARADGKAYEITK